MDEPMKFILPLLITLSWLDVASVAQSSAPLIGYVAHVSGTVQLQPASGADKALTLTPGYSVGHKLYEGDRITCGPAASAILEIGARKYDLSDLDRTVTLHSGKVTESEKRANDAIAKLGMPGASRSIGSLIYSPAADASVRLSSFHVRWNPPSDPEPLQFTLTDAKGTTLWSQSGVDSSSGFLAPQPEAALIHALTTQPNATGFTLNLLSEMHGSQHVNFALLTPTQEAALDVELKFWAAERDPLLGLIGAAEALEAANLPVDAAYTYDDALKIAPQSEVLLEAALGLYQSLGNRVRIQQLRAALEAARVAESS